MIAEGDRVAARLTTSAKHTGTFMGIDPSGRRYSIDEIHIFRIRDGQLVEHWHAFDTASLMAQLKGAQQADGQS
jgi:predicted ester cyclase